MASGRVSGYYRYNAEGNRYYVPGDICQYEFDRVLQVVHRLQYQLRDEVGTQARGSCTFSHYEEFS